MPTLCDATSPPTYPAREYGINHRTIIYTNIYTKFTNIDRLTVEIVHILVIIAAVTDSRQSPKITVGLPGEIHGNHGDREFVIYIHPKQ